eukprot:UN21601
MKLNWVESFVQFLILKKVLSSQISFWVYRIIMILGFLIRFCHRKVQYKMVGICQCLKNLARYTEKFKSLEKHFDTVEIKMKKIKIQ